jgi:translation initiation factor 3 subunit C
MSRFFRQAGDSDSDSSSSEEEELMTSDDERPSKPAAPATKTPMSRFLRTAGSESSDSESSDEEESMSEEEEKGAPKKSRFLKTESDEEDSDEDAKRVVKSAKDKRLEEMEATGKTMDNALKINDWVAISNGVSCSGA